MTVGVFPGDCDEKGRIVFDIPAQVVAFCRKAFAGKRVDVEIRQRKAKRSDRQNRAYHAAIKPWADFLGDDVESVKQDMLALVFGSHLHRSKVSGEWVRVLEKPHTSTLTVAEFSQLMDRTVITAAQTGYVMPLPDEFRAG